MADEQLQNYERLCPSYATAPFKTLGLSTDGMMLFMVFLVLTRHFIDSSWFLFFAWGAAYAVQRTAEKQGFRDGFLQIKVSTWVTHPLVMKYAPQFSAAVARVWKSKGSIPAAGYKSRFSR